MGAISVPVTAFTATGDFSATQAGATINFLMLSAPTGAFAGLILGVLLIPFKKPRLYPYDPDPPAGA